MFCAMCVALPLLQLIPLPPNLDNIMPYRGLLREIQGAAAIDTSWWPISLKHLPPEQQVEMLVYFGARDAAQAEAALQNEFALFSRDAQEACRRWSVEYPASLEQAVRGHLRRMG